MRATWLIAVSLLAATAGAGEILVVDDFFYGQKPNALGGDFGAWNMHEDDATQRCVDQFDQEHAYGGAGYCVRLDYDVDSPNPAHNGFWMKLRGADLRPYTWLVLALRGDPDHRYTTQLYVELKNNQEIGRYLLKGITDTWQVFRIPLAAFEGLHDLSEVVELVIVFDDQHATHRVGTIYLDEVMFEN